MALTIEIFLIFQDVIIVFWRFWVRSSPEGLPAGRIVRFAFADGLTSLQDYHTVPQSR